MPRALGPQFTDSAEFGAVRSRTRTCKLPAIGRIASLWAAVYDRRHSKFAMFAIRNFWRFMGSLDLLSHARWHHEPAPKARDALAQGNALGNRHVKMPPA